MARVLALLVGLEGGAGADDQGIAEPAEVVRDGRGCWVACDRVSPAAVARLQAHLCLSETTDEGSAIERLSLTGAGRAAARRPGILAEIAGAVRSGARFSVAGDRVAVIDGAVA